MKIHQWFLAIGTVCALGYAAQAATYTYSGPLPSGGLIPDGDANGWSATLSLPIDTIVQGNPALAASDTIVADTLRVNLNISGGYNGDLYGYLVHGSSMAVLLNRVGVSGVAGVSASGTTIAGEAGSSASGFNVTFVAGLTPDIHTIVGTPGQPIVNGAVAVDGRQVSSLAGQTFNSALRPATLTSFNDQTAAGDWTIYFADLSSGFQSTVTGWGFSFDVNAIPEPVHVALGIFGALFGAVQLGRYVRRRAKQA
jgi:hypothetical protein